ncbi:hypothetical protein D3C81_210240 [compost metagenome]
MYQNDLDRGETVIFLGTALKKYAAEELKHNSFSLDPTENRGGGRWVYSRPSGEVTQYIVFFKSSHQQNALRVELSTSLKRTDVKYLSHFTRGQEEWWYFTDESSLGLAICEMTRLLSQYGYRWLELKSTPDLLPDVELGSQLLRNPTERANHFENKYNLDKMRLTSFKVIEDILLENKNTYSGLVDWELIMNASAFIGEVICQKYNCKWIWNEDYDTPAVANNERITVNVLRRVSLFWGNPELPEYSLDKMPLY